jgi:IS30 family transposase
MTYKRITKEERIFIYRWGKEDKSINEMGRLLGRAPSSISREISRNTGGKSYRPKQAHEKSREKAKRPGIRQFTEEIRIDAETRLKYGWTPDIISNRAKLEGRPYVCKETIYKYIYADAKKGGNLWTNLPRSKRKRRRRCPRVEGRGRGKIPNQRMIETRPKEVETRKVAGHWEGDLINGAHGTGNLVTLVERKFRFTLVGRTKTKEANEVTNEMCDLFESLPAITRSGLTLDNGKEFAWHEKIAAKVNIDVFFANPYHSWERGTNENTNGLIRRLHPKKSSFAGIGVAELAKIETYLNDRPRKCLGWYTPREKMAAFLSSASQ